MQRHNADRERCTEPEEPNLMKEVMGHDTAVLRDEIRQKVNGFIKTECHTKSPSKVGILKVEFGSDVSDITEKQVVAIIRASETHEVLDVSFSSNTITADHVDKVDYAKLDMESVF